MLIFEHILLAIGGVALFLTGLKYMSDNMELLTGDKMKKLLNSCTKNKYYGVLTGAFSTAIVQSSVATNVIVCSFVSNGIITFLSASAVIMGTNIGTTITAQLVSLSGKESFNVTALGSLALFLGFIFLFIKRKNFKEIGGVMMGFGMLFIGLDIISSSINFFKNFEWFRRIFLVDNHLVLLLNGLIITSLVQSSSAVTSVMIILASNGLITFENSMFLIFGANIGTCFAVILAASNKSAPTRQTAFFNLAFNIFGSIIFFLPVSIFSEEVAYFFSLFSSTIERQIANFHTLFNLTVTLILLPILKPFTKLITLIIKDDKPKRNKKAVKLTIVSSKNR